MSHSTTAAPFGSILGYAPGNVAVYSSDYATADSAHFPDRESYRSYIDDIFMGYKWQCVEFARRWLYLNYGYIFDDVAMAYDIFELRHLRSVRDNRLRALQSFKNGCPRRPEPGCLLIWNEGGEFERTGHVAIVTEVFDNALRIVEQNLDHRCWPEGQPYSRELAAHSDDQGRYWVSCSFAQGSILGWVICSDDECHAEPRPSLDTRLLELQSLSLAPAQPLNDNWLDASLAQQSYQQAVGGALLSNAPSLQRRYYALSETAIHELKHASNELHAMFMHATHHVLKSDQLLQRFCLPQSIWPKIRQFWNNRKNQMITGRFDFSVSARGIKLYEYNADSASCYLETAQLQGQWLCAHGVSEGRCPGEQLFPHLVQAWRKSAIDCLHILRDDDPEENYHALFMQDAAKSAGLRCKIIVGMQGLGWDAQGYVVDGDGERIENVWKTWAWETALDQLRIECDEELALATIGADHPREDHPRLIDVLLRQGVMVYEPLWTLIPSNKAILPILWQLFPQHPYLLESHYQLTPALKNNGYVSKPIAGRCGFNISLVNADNDVLRQTEGQFGEQENIFQQFFPLPQLDQLYIQVGTFSVDGRYSAASVRVDQSPVITTFSDILPLRVLADSHWQ